MEPVLVKRKLINPQIPISAGVHYDIHGITNEMVKECARFQTGCE